LHRAWRDSFEDEPLQGIGGDTMKPLIKSVTSFSLISAALVGCGSDSTGPAEPPIGSYTAIEFVTTGNSGQTNQLVIGGSLQMNLAANGTTSGHLHMAASGSNPVVDADMAGTWTLNGNVVDFTQTADTFVRDMVFILQPIATDTWDLVGDQGFSGTRIQLTLRHLP
jgi:hypothetical protein